MGWVGEGSHRCAGLLLVLTPPLSSGPAPFSAPPLPRPLCAGVAAQSSRMTFTKLATSVSLASWEVKKGCSWRGRRGRQTGREYYSGSAPSGVHSRLLQKSRRDFFFFFSCTHHEFCVSRTLFGNFLQAFTGHKQNSESQPKKSKSERFIFIIT